MTSRPLSLETIYLRTWLRMPNNCFKAWLLSVGLYFLEMVHRTPGSRSPGMLLKNAEIWAPPSIVNQKLWVRDQESVLSK